LALALSERPVIRNSALIRLPLPAGRARIVGAESGLRRQASESPSPLAARRGTLVP